MSFTKFLILIFVTLTIPLYTGYSQVWVQQTPKPTTSLLQTAKFFDNTGWIVGVNGTILKTKDSGHNWENVSEKFTNDWTLELLDICFNSKNTGWIAGDIINYNNFIYSAILLKTTDNGITWDTSFVLKDNQISYRFVSVSFTDSLTGFAAGFSIDGKILLPIIFKTTDGGNNWIQITGDWSQVNSVLFSLAFTDKNHGWAAGMIDNKKGMLILSTADAGNTWNTSYRLNSSASELSSIFFKDLNHGWACGTYQKENQEIIGIVIRTTDGGINWISDTTNNNFLNNSLTSVFFIDNQEGYVAGQNIDPNGNQKGIIAKTTNGGINWIKSKTDNNFQSFNSVYFTDRFNGYIACNFGRVLETSDAGNTWIEKPLNTKFDNYMYNPFFLDSLNGWSGGSNAVMYTKDGGKIWSELFKDSLYSWQNVRFFDVNNGIICGNYLNSNKQIAAGSVKKTTDGGINWSEITVPIGKNYNYQFNSMIFIDNLNGFIGGSYYPQQSVSSLTPIIFKTTDSGNTWNYDTTGLSGYKGLTVYSLYCMDKDNIFACVSSVSQFNERSKVFIFKSTNAGVLWDVSYQEEMESQGELFNVTFADKLHGWAVGSYQNNTVSYLINTSDGGLTWNKIDFASNNMQLINNILFLNEQNGWLSGNHDLTAIPNLPVFHTDNGGRDWIAIHRFDYSNPLYMFFLNNEKGWAVGDNGRTFSYKILKIRTGKPEFDSYCNGEEINIPFEIPESLEYDINFVAQISDSTGSFKYTPVIGTSQSNHSGLIKAVIPADLPPGNYRIRVWDSDNSFPINIRKAPSPKIKGPLNACKDIEIEYSTEAEDGVTYDWQAEGGTISGNRNSNRVIVVWNQTGFNKLTVSATKFTSSCLGIASVNVKVSEQGFIPDLDFSGKTEICYTDSLIQEYQNNEPDVENIWHVSGGIILGDNRGNLFKVKLDPGRIDTVFLEQTIRTGNCRQTLFKTIKVDSVNLDRVIKGDTVVCLDVSETFSTSSRSGNSYKWHIDNAEIISDDNTENVKIMWHKPGIYTLYLDIQSPLGCFKTEQIIIDADLTRAGIIGDSSVCNDTNIIYTYYSVYKGFNNLWSVNKGSIITDPTKDSINVIWRGSGFRFIQLKQTLPNGCSKQISKVIRSKIPELSLSAPEIEVDPSKYFDTPISITFTTGLNTCLSNIGENDTLVTTVRIRREIFLPLKNDHVNWYDIGNWRVINISYAAKDIKSGNFSPSFEGYVLLGNILESPIIIDSIKLMESDIILYKSDGKIILTGIPDTGGLRLLSNRTFQFKGIMPNPSDGSFEIDIFSLADQKINIRIIDVLGNKLFSNQYNVTIGNNSLNIDDIKLNSGYYMILIGNDVDLLSTQIIIRR